ncbi:MAG TPA: TetR/AcrR family transcriptional regulator [Solirubrobacteraceae bacterium]|jgi:AcrR family transcriptional regulator|nr:TetR/AcrR family transcriptional regulator [Solirubrobacteraceae bacterium]
MSTVRRRARVSLSTGAPARRGGVQVSEAQRARMLSSAAAVVAEYGYGQMSVARVTARARVSRRTFYDVFEDREDCFLALFEDAIARVTDRVVPAYERERAWREQVRAGLSALLVFLDERPEVGSLLVVDALSAGPPVLRRRAEILAGLGAVLDRDGSRSKHGRGLAEITGEGVVGAVFSVIHTRLLAKRSGALMELLNPLVSMVVLPYLGSGAAQRELERPGPKLARRSGGASNGAGVSVGPAEDPLAGLPMRLTYRTLRVLGAIGDWPGASNRGVAENAGVLDQGQMSKLLARLERLGLIRNAAAQGAHQPTGEPNAWRLTARGEEVERAVGVTPSDDAHVESVGGGR